MPDGADALALGARPIVDRVPPDVRAGLTAGRREATALAADEPAWTDHPVHFRLSLPSPLGRVYVVPVAARRARDPGHHPLAKRGNLVIGAAGLLCGIPLGASALF